jgi:hypothetical protein
MRFEFTMREDARQAADEGEQRIANLRAPSFSQDQEREAVALKLS